MTNYSAVRGRSRRPGVIDELAMREFYPDQIDGLRLWFDANQISGLNDDDPVDTWEDLSTFGSDATGAGGTRPTYKTNIVNGLPVVRYAGNYYLDHGNVDLATGAYFIVWSRTNAANNDAVLLQSGTAYSYLQYGTSWYTSSVTSGVVAMAAGTFFLKSCVYNGTTHQRYTNTTAEASQNSVLGLTLRYIGPAGFALNGDIAELVVYSGVPAVADIALLQWYFNRKYALW